MKLEQVYAPDFDLAMTLDSGQAFHWIRSGDGYAGAIGDQPAYVEQRNGLLFVNREAGKVARRYFALDHPLAEICASLPEDAAMCAARDFCRGLRIMRQPLWECLASFITSSMKQVAHIRQMSHALRTRFGDEKKLSDFVIYAFPAAHRVAALHEGDLRKCALGYRAKNLLKTARLVSSGAADLNGWRELDDDQLRVRLCELPGVGAKVANCVMLFAYERLRAFPIDVWIERVLREKYFARKRKVTPQRLRTFCDTYFGEHGGYAQQYLFHYARKGGTVRRATRRGGGRLSLPATCDTVGRQHKPAGAKEPPERCTLRDSRATPS